MPNSPETRVLAGTVMESIYFMSGAIPRKRNFRFIESTCWVATAVIAVGVLSLFAKAAA